jgi:hypothetical protein
MAAWPSPSYEDMRAVMAAMYDACRRHRIPIGMAPNIEVSLVVTPDDAALLAPRTPDFYAYEAWRRVVRLAARPVFRRRLRPGPRAWTRLTTHLRRARRAGGSPTERTGRSQHSAPRAARPRADLR